MYAYLEGLYSFKSPTTVYLDVNGVGYLVQISLNTYGVIDKLEKGRLYTHLHVKEDILALYGFATEEEKQLFILLLSVSGIGPNTARIILSSMTPIEVRTAIVSENDLAFKKVKGVGPKTAKRVILDLKDKVKKGEAIPQGQMPAITSSSDQATEALLALGFQRQKIKKALEGIDSSSESTTESIIKKALQRLT